MSMRAIVDKLLQDVEGLTEDNIYSAGAIQEDSIPGTPFAVVRMGETGIGIGAVRRRSAVIWIHDEPGDYTRIDNIIHGIYARMDGAEHVRDPEDASELIVASWSGTSDDLNDAGFRTITKNTSFTLIGSGA